MLLLLLEREILKEISSAGDSHQLSRVVQNEWWWTVECEDELIYNELGKKTRDQESRI